MKKNILLLLLVGLLLGCGEKKATLKKVKTARIERKNIEDTSLYSGRVFPGDKTQLIAYSNGIAEEVFFKAGDEVKEGDILFKYRSTGIKENEIKLAEVKLELDMVQSELANYEVEKKETGIKNRELEIKALEYEVQKGRDILPILRSEIQSATKVVAMYREFLKEESVSIFELEQKRTELLNKEAQYTSAKMKLELDEQKYNILVLTKDGVEKEIQYKEERLKSKYEALKKDVEIYERALLESREGVRAIKDGILTSFNIQIDERVERLQNIGVLASGDNLVVSIRVPVYGASKIKAGQKVNVKFGDFTGISHYKGEVSRVSNFATESGSKLGIDVEIEILEGDLTLLKPGYRVEVQVLSSEMKEYLLVKRFSVIEENGKKYIYTIEDGKAVKKEIIVGVQGETDYEVLNLNEGTKIILNPFVINDGDVVEEIE
ncbi:MAG: efflux RND transporter periplasmic adaptor subunit [Cetobacterium sp.]|uniref:efflux RND transporter periplasmic adaptor subunit n=1 Tax=Cetobacterium sp. TaxID=2071632 RepID=UPI003F355988